MPKNRFKKQRKSLEPLEAIRRLLILIAIQNGASSEEVAKVLNIDPSTIRHIVSIRAIKKASK